MTRVVIDTNILISSILANGPPAVIIDMVADGKLKPFYNDQIICEYWNVLHRPKFGFVSVQINQLIDIFMKTGMVININRPSAVSMIDEEDRKFYDVAKTSHAYLITGNIKHYPKENLIVTPANFLKEYLHGTQQK